jgi:hypothetical protein
MRDLQQALNHVLVMAELWATQCDLEDMRLCKAANPDRWVTIKAVEEWAVEQDILPDPHAAPEEFMSLDVDERPFDLQPPMKEGPLEAGGYTIWNPDDELGEADTNH